jgi:L-lactate dehydrogenase complex protein LldG
MSSRELILSRVRAALADRPSVPTIEPPEPAVATPAATTAELFAERASAYGSGLRRTDAVELGPTLAAVVREHAVRELGTAPGVPQAWFPDGCEVCVDHHTTPRNLERFDASLTGCELAIAVTGTIVLASGGVSGRRALTLIPDLHICVVFEHQVVPTIAAALSRLAPTAGATPPPLTFVSGPSATSDIELSRVSGVHGPRRLEIILVAADA